jgi:kynurenine 3-monooxygenase
MAQDGKKQKTVVVGAGPVGALAAIYAAQRGHDVEIYELRSGTSGLLATCLYLYFSIGFASWKAYHHECEDIFIAV